MVNFLFTVEQVLDRKETPYEVIINSKLNQFVYKTVNKQIYYILQIDNTKIKILDKNNIELAKGVLTKKEPKILTFEFDESKMLFSGGYMTIDENECILYFYGSGLPYTTVEKGSIKKLIIKN